MTRDHVLKIINIVFPIAGIGLMVFYEVCDTSCSALRGTFMGLDLKVIGIMFMAVLLALTLLPVSRSAASAGYLQTLFLSGALGGEVLLVRFQIVNDTYCPFCLAFGSCILILFAVNFTRMNRYLTLGTFLAGIIAFALFFEGSIIPFYR